MLQYFFTIISWFYGYPLVNKIIKKSIMGYEYDKTIDYYRNLPLLTPLDEEFIVNFKVGNNDYTINCESETYNEAIKYIKSFRNFTKNCILSAYEDTGVEVTDITQKVLRYSGPYCNFYSGTNFEVKCSDITDYSLCIISDELNVFTFKRGDVINLERPSYYLKRH